LINGRWHRSLSARAGVSADGRPPAAAAAGPGTRTVSESESS
jgi:hypothetical protein